MVVARSWGRAERGEFLFEERGSFSGLMFRHHPGPWTGSQGTAEPFGAKDIIARYHLKKLYLSFWKCNFFHSFPPQLTHDCMSSVLSSISPGSKLWAGPAIPIPNTQSLCKPQGRLLSGSAPSWLPVPLLTHLCALSCPQDIDNVWS